MRDEESVDVLLIGESVGSFSHIVERLEKSGCRCRFANSYEEAQQLLADETFELVLSVIAPHANSISSLADRLVGTHASVYYAQPVEDGCWWLPALRLGQRCFGTPALRPSEFAGVLGQLVQEVRTGHRSELKPVVRMFVLPDERRPQEPAMPAIKLHSKIAG
jgi:hypothetical protein